MNKCFHSVVIFLLFYFLMAGCSQEGCMDSNAVNYNAKANKSDGFCTFRYLSLVVVNKIPQRVWEDAVHGYNNPNLKFYMKMSEEVYWQVETTVAINNTIYPYSWKIDITGNDHLLWDKMYEFLLTNESFTGRDIIVQDTFVPSQVYNNNKIILENKEETVEIELDFVVF